MSSTLSTVFSTTVTDCFVNNVASHLSGWLQENKSVEVSPTEICKAFNVPYSPSTISPGYPQSASMGAHIPNLPGHLQGTKKPRKPRTKTERDPNAPTCKYVFQRGANKGKECKLQTLGGDTLGADRYCKNCLKKTSVKTILDMGSQKSTVQPPIMPGGNVPVPEQDSKSGGNTLNVVAIEGQDNMFKDTTYDFIIQRCDDGALIALGIEDNGVQRDLTQSEKNQAQTMGLSIVSEKPSSPPTIPQVVAQVPQVVAQVPQVVPQQVVAQVPQVVPQQVVAQVPQVVPQQVVAQVPQVVPQQVPQVVPQQVVAQVPQVVAQVPQIVQMPVS